MKKKIKLHKPNEFYVRKDRGCFLVIDNYDKSVASLELDEEVAHRIAADLNDSRNKRLNISYGCCRAFRNN